MVVQLAATTLCREEGQAEAKGACHPPRDASYQIFTRCSGAR